MMTTPENVAHRETAENHDVKQYRPKVAAALDSVMAALLLNQIIYWWVKMGERPFYKFRDACTHEKYTPGSSWCDELVWNKCEFDNALRVIGTKIKKGVSKQEVLETHYPDRAPGETDKAYMQRVEDALKCLVLYWTDANHQTWYQLNEALYAEFSYRIYLTEFTSLRQLRKFSFSIQLAGRRNRIQQKNSDSEFISSTEDYAGDYQKTTTEEKESAVADGVTDVTHSVEEISEPAPDDTPQPPIPPAPPFPKVALKDVVLWAWRLQPLPSGKSGREGNIVGLLVGNKHGRGKWAEFALDDAATAAEIVGFRLWHRTVKSEVQFPEAAETINDNVMLFRQHARYEEFMRQGTDLIAHYAATGSWQLVPVMPQPVVVSPSAEDVPQFRADVHARLAALTASKSASSQRSSAHG